MENKSYQKWNIENGDFIRPHNRNKRWYKNYKKRVQIRNIAVLVLFLVIIIFVVSYIAKKIAF